MRSGTGIFVHGGNYRPNWMKANQSCGTVHFAFSVEVPEGEQWSAGDVIREKIEESVVYWSRLCYRKLEKESRERKEKNGKKKRCKIESL